MHGLKMKTTVKRDWLLVKLEENRTAHEACYEESRLGYIENAQVLLPRLTTKVQLRRRAERRPTNKNPPFAC